MAENKQYVTQTQENGAVMISEDVIATIASTAITEVEGVVGLGNKSRSDIAEMIGRKNWGKSLRVIVGENNELTIDCNVTVAFGQSVVAIAKAVQEAVTNAVEATACIKVDAVNVNVCGIIRQ